MSDNKDDVREAKVQILGPSDTIQKLADVFDELGLENYLQPEKSELTLKLKGPEKKIDEFMELLAHHLHGSLMRLEK